MWNAASATGIGSAKQLEELISKELDSFSPINTLEYILKRRDFLRKIHVCYNDHHWPKCIIFLRLDDYINLEKIKFDNSPELLFIEFYSDKRYLIQDSYNFHKSGLRTSYYINKGMICEAEGKYSCRMIDRNALFNMRVVDNTGCSNEYS